MQFMRGRLIVVAQAVSQRKLTGNLPGILREETPCHFAVLRRLRIGDAGVVHGASQEAGVREAHRAALQVLSLSGWQPGFGSTEIVKARDSERINLGKRIQSPLAAHLVGIISPIY